MGVLQALSMADVPFPIRGESLLYLSLTAHGVLMALVFTTFFVIGLGYAVVEASLGRMVGQHVGWIGFWIALTGAVMTAVTILRGQSSVLYTFYPPLQAHPLFYIGATLIVIGSWLWGGVLVASFRVWRRAHRQEPIPLATHGMLTTVIIWYLATAGLAVEMLGMLIPWSLGWVATIDPLVARIYFWWFGHPLVYFWLLPVYVLWYTVLPHIAGGRLFSDSLARMVFVLFLLLSTPVGFHHQFSDPGISAGWKLAHTVTTYAVVYPSLVTAFTVIASLEVAGRMKGALGLFDWIGAAPLVGAVLRVDRAGHDRLCLRRHRRRDQRGLRDELDGAQHRLDSGALPRDARHHGRADVHGRHLLADAATARPRGAFPANGAPAALPVVRWDGGVFGELSRRRAAGDAATCVQRRAGRRPGRRLAWPDDGGSGGRSRALRERDDVRDDRRGDLAHRARVKLLPIEFAVSLRAARRRQPVGSARSVDGDGCSPRRAGIWVSVGPAPCASAVRLPRVPAILIMRRFPLRLACRARS